MTPNSLQKKMDQAAAVAAVAAEGENFKTLTGTLTTSITPILSSILRLLLLPARITLSTLKLLLKHNPLASPKRLLYLLPLPPLLMAALRRPPYTLHRPTPSQLLSYASRSSPSSALKAVSQLMFSTPLLTLSSHKPGTLSAVRLVGSLGRARLYKTHTLLLRPSDPARRRIRARRNAPPHAASKADDGGGGCGPGPQDGGGSTVSYSSSDAAIAVSVVGRRVRVSTRGLG
eukprot:CAMPEP_0182462434 /NCGR_PEP_ID=MMETSP1319-20130603/6695_1 /TAXON_ID=172717 /ORGANISM="Bolidomonas pacifica, Strain RCC208" /LENGTH=230 /DNA_ID=CAMNT_0024661867 /DNA_START=472 /DNA_END=1161 /DNA_ORIENTATION=-